MREMCALTRVQAISRDSQHCCSRVLELPQTGNRDAVLRLCPRPGPCLLHYYLNKLLICGKGPPLPSFFFFFFPSLLTTLFLSQAPSFLDFVLIFTPYHPGMKVHKQARSCVAAWLLVGSTNYRSMHAHFSTMPNERVTGKRSKHIFPQRSSVNHHYQFMN